MGEGTEQKNWVIFLILGFGLAYDAYLRAKGSLPGQAIVFGFRRLRRITNPSS